MQRRYRDKRQVYNPVGRKRWLRRAIAQVKNRPKKPGFSPEAWAAGTAFFIHHLKHPKPVPYEDLTPLQKRMQSGLSDGGGIRSKLRPWWNFRLMPFWCGTLGLPFISI